MRYSSLYIIVLSSVLTQRCRKECTGNGKAKWILTVETIVMYFELKIHLTKMFDAITGGGGSSCQWSCIVGVGYKAIWGRLRLFLFPFLSFLSLPFPPFFPFLSFLNIYSFESEKERERESTVASEQGGEGERERES